MGLFLSSLAGCERETDSLALSRLGAAKMLTVNVFQPTKTENAIRTASYFGTLHQGERATLRFPSGGRLVSVAGFEQRFKKGDVLAELDSSQLVGQRKRIQSDLARIPEQLSGPNKMAQLQSDLDRINRQIASRTLLAPYECTVERVMVSADESVGPSSPIVAIVENGNPKIHMGMPRKISKYVSAGESFVFLLDDVVVDGELTKKSSTENPPGTIALQFKITSDLSDVDFAFGQTVEARFDFETDASGYWLPLTSFRRSSEGLWSVFVVEPKDDRFFVSQKIVTVLQLRDDDALVSDDLSGRQVIINGVHRVTTGFEVAINPVADAERTNSEANPADRSEDEKEDDGLQLDASLEPFVELETSDIE